MDDKNFKECLNIYNKNIERLNTIRFRDIKFKKNFKDFHNIFINWDKGFDQLINYLEYNPIKYVEFLTIFLYKEKITIENKLTSFILILIIGHYKWESQFKPIRPVKYKIPTLFKYFKNEKFTEILDIAYFFKRDKLYYSDDFFDAAIMLDDIEELMERKLTNN